MLSFELGKPIMTFLSSPFMKVMIRWFGKAWQAGLRYDGTCFALGFLPIEDDFKVSNLFTIARYITTELALIQG